MGFCNGRKIFGSEVIIGTFNAVVQTNDSGYIMAGRYCSTIYGPDTKNGALIIKVDSNGNFLWSKTYYDGRDADILSIRETDDQDYIMVGSIPQNDNDGFLIKQEKIIEKAPNKPKRPNGKIFVKAGVTYTYSTGTTDPEGKKIKYGFYWDDGTVTWTDWINSGETAYAEHAWSKKGRHYICVKAVDETELESEWSNILTVVVLSDSEAYSLPRSNQQVKSALNQQNSLLIHNLIMNHLMTNR